MYITCNTHAHRNTHSHIYRYISVCIYLRNEDTGKYYSSQTGRSFQNCTKQDIRDYTRFSWYINVSSSSSTFIHVQHVLNDIIALSTCSLSLHLPFSNGPYFKMYTLQNPDHVKRYITIYFCYDKMCRNEKYAPLLIYIHFSCFRLNSRTSDTAPGTSKSSFV